MSAPDLPSAWWVVSWQRDGVPYVIDFVGDDETAVARFAAELTESGRDGVIVVRAAPLDVDPGTRERIWQRVRERLEREVPESLVP
jgi:alkanesulfonate monooxygenase SsuD/methylene tetrahydromethanopterin reductase-like flavin-dependent oxidoreductase (luciferase family)